MTLAPTFPDWLTDYRAWLRAQPDLAAIHGGRVFFRIPTNQPPSQFPLLRVYQVTGAPDTPGDDSPWYRATAGVELWGSDGSMYDQLRALRRTMDAAHASLAAEQLNPPNGGTYVGWAAVLGAIDSPDPDTGWPRYVMTTQLWCRVPGAGDGA